MKIYQALHGDKVNQCFGENKSPIYKKEGKKGHNGTDFAAYWSQPVYFNVDSATTWTAVNYIDLDGNRRVNVISDDTILDIGYRLRVRFMHLSSFDEKVPAGTKYKIKLGTRIGYAGNTGRGSRGTHLHVDYALCDTDGQVVNRKNGFDGCVDLPNYQHFVLDILGKKEKLTFLQSCLKVIHSFTSC